jgi:putative thioredoxin
MPALSRATPGAATGEHLHSRSENYRPRPELRRGYRGAMDVTDATFEAAVVDRSAEVPVVVDFWAEWCGPCKTLGPVLEREIETRAGAVELAKIDVDANREVSQRFGISGIPAVKAFRDGRVVAEFVGVRSPTAVSAFFDDLLAPPRADALVDGLRAEGVFPEIVAALDAGDTERALELIVATAIESAPPGRDRLRDLAVALFERLGHEDPLAATYRRKLASALY